MRRIWYAVLPALLVAIPAVVLAADKIAKVCCPSCAGCPICPC